MLIKRASAGCSSGARGTRSGSAPQVDVVEPSGAGDAFAAGLVLGILEELGPRQKARFASVLGGVGLHRARLLGRRVHTQLEAKAYLREHILLPRPRGARRPEPRYPVTSKDPFIELAWGSQTKVGAASSCTSNDSVPSSPTLVDTSTSPGPVGWKLCAEDWSSTSSS